MPAAWRDLTVAAQHADPGSTLALYREALRVRRAHPALGDGALRWLDGPPGTLSFVRESAGGGRLVCAVNLGGQAARVPVPGTPLLAGGPYRADGDAAELPPATAVRWDVPATA